MLRTMNFHRPLINTQENASFEQALTRAIPNSDLSAVGFVGIIGSMSKDNTRFGHDIDLIMFPNPAVPLGETMEQVDNLLYETDAIMRKDHNLTISPSGRKLRQEVNWLEVHKATGMHPLMVHRLIYPDKASFLSIEPKGFFECAKSEAVPYFGSWDAIEQNPARDQNVLDAHYWLEWYDLGSHCPPAGMKRDPRLLFMEAEAAFDYISKHYAHVDKRALEKANPAELRVLVRDVRDTIDRLAA